MSSYWFETAVVGGLVRSAVRVEESDGVFSRVETDVAARDADTRLGGLVLPGLANGHSHAFHRALRGRIHGDGGTFWSWRQRMYSVAAQLTPESYFELATAVFAEMVQAGYAVVGEFHYLHRYLHDDLQGSLRRSLHRGGETSTAMEDAVVSAAERAGIRMTLLDTLYLQGGLAGDGTVLPLSGVQERFSDGSIDAWGERHRSIRIGGTVRLGAAIHSVRAVDAALFPAFREFVDGEPVHAHVSEQPAENAQSLAAWGRTPIELFADAGLLGRHFTAVHGTHLSEHDVQLLADSRSTVCFCPTTERDLADGIGGAGALFSAGASLSLGSDQNAVIDPFEELRGLEMDARLATGQRGRFTPAELLHAATVVGYESLGWNGGQIAVGHLADFVAVATGTPRTAGAALDQLWLAATSADVTTVVVGGRTVVADGRHELGDVGALLAAALEKINS